MNNAVNQNRTAYRAVPGKGYKRVGAPAMPAQSLGMPGACEPSSGTAGGLHMLKPPAERQADPVPFTWHPEKREWETFGHVGKRVAFTSAYLAAHGWTYGYPR